MPEYKFRQYIERAIDEIDAGLFSGDAFGSNEAIAAMEEVLARWTRGLADNRKLNAEWEAEQAAKKAAKDVAK